MKMKNLFLEMEAWNYYWKTGKFACMRELFEDINERNTRMRHPSPMLVIDETLYPYCGHIGFKQYISNKPAKYSLLYWGLCDSSLPYTYYSLPYAGKPKEVKGPAANYYNTQVFIQALLCTAVFPQRFNFFIVCLVHWVCRVAPW